MLPAFRPLWLFLLALTLATPTQAQRRILSDTETAVLTRIAEAEAEVRKIDGALDTKPDEEEQAALRVRAEAAGKLAAAAITDMEAQLATLDTRIAELGAPAAGGEAPEIARQRAVFAAERKAVDAAIRRGKLVTVEAGQLSDEIDRSRGQQITAELSVRVASPVTPAFWNAVLRALPRDIRRIELFVQQGAAQVRAQWRGGLPWQLPLGAVIAIVIAFPLRVRAKALARRYLIEEAPGHRLRRSGNALQRIVVDTAAPLLAAVAFITGLQAAGMFPARWNDVLAAFITAAGFGGFTAAVTGTMLMTSQPSWRLAPIDDNVARRLRPLAWLLAWLSGLAIIVNAFNDSVGASQPAQTATAGVEAILRVTLLVVALVTLGRARAAAAEEGEPVEKVVGAGLNVIGLVSWIMALATALMLLTGYIALAAFLLRILGWALVLGCAAYILAGAIDDVATTVLSRDSPLGRGISRATGLSGSAIDQIGLITSGIARLALLIVALALLVTPFGSGGGIGAMFGRLGTLAQGIRIGGVSISPGAILRGIVVLLIGLALVRAFMRWLDERYLPVTDLDTSSRNSVSLVAKYVGIALAIIWGLASLGIGVERIALLLSALSVGIGFGLQAITQNFISGLILLAERPIKIGDLVRVGTDEGDVKRISVRSTEIELADHSTLIVPNSELITKSVLNKTRAGPLGRVQIQFSVPIETDVRRIRDIVLGVFAGGEAILDDPEPKVFIDSIAPDGRVLFNCIAHTSSPRTAYGARSNALLALLAQFHDEGIDIGSAPTRMELIPAPASGVSKT